MVLQYSIMSVCIFLYTYTAVSVVHIYMYIFIHTYIHTYIHTWIHSTYIRTYVVRMHIYIHLYPTIPSRQGLGALGKASSQGPQGVRFEVSLSFFCVSFLSTSEYICLWRDLQDFVVFLCCFWFLQGICKISRRVLTGL